MLCFIFIFIFLHCPLSGPVLIYISLLIISCIIEYVMNKNNLEPWNCGTPNGTSFAHLFWQSPNLNEIFTFMFDRRKSYSFRVTWGWVNEDFYFGVNYPFRSYSLFSLQSISQIQYHPRLPPSDPLHQAWHHASLLSCNRSRGTRSVRDPVRLELWNRLCRYIAF